MSDPSEEHSGDAASAIEEEGPQPARAPDSAVDDAAAPSDERTLTVEDLLETLEQVTVERDQHFDSLQRLQAEFENFRKRSAGENEQRIAVGLARLAESLLPVLDRCEAAVAQGLEQVTPIHNSLTVSLEKEGLERIAAVGAVFDPNEHEAVMHEPGDGGEQVVVEELRSGYRWKGRVLRAAMVKVRD